MSRSRAASPSPVEFRFAEMQRSQGVDHLPFLAGFVSVTDALRGRRVDYVELLLVLRGRGRLVVFRGGSEVEHELSPGQLLMFRSDDDTLIESIGRAAITFLGFSFARSDWETFASFVGLGPDWRTSAQPPMVRLPPGADLQRPFLRARRQREGSPSRMDLLRFLVDAVPRLLDTDDRHWGAGGAPQWLTEGLALMRDEDNLRGGVPRLQELCHVSAPYLSVSVRRHYGMTPTAMVGELRVRAAALLLSTTAASVTEIAARCGFSSVAHLSNSFRRIQGSSPREYRLRRGG